MTDNAVPLHHNADLRSRNTLRLSARAEWLALPQDSAALAALLRDPRWRGQPRTVIGEGSNLVLAADIPGLVICPQLRGRQRLTEQDDQVLVEVGAGEHWDDVVAWSLGQGWQGLENLSLIPGACGAAPFQNIGAYGVELSDVLEAVEALSLEDGSARTFTRDECGFAYRDSRFKSAERGQWLITRLRLRLNRTPRLQLGYADLAAQFSALPETLQTPAGVRDLICQIRRAKLPDPATLPNAGSFFKNPCVSTAQHADLLARFPDLVAFPQADGQMKLAAGWLIEQAGWKGRRVGDLGMHAQQALVLVNHGAADGTVTGADVLAFAAQVRDSVQARFGVTLEQEPVILPAHSERGA
ncbi:UDP-N-acetylmuramate dehydrogenase [Isoalcanivorax indicus]|uniref:UDP-N-acetylmuramate dehydrogenase n=1 Tax=Isoalcanivorax indicus TaxID=2202653 RepID=UPI000DB96F82|nr:UDP-N-acetylmuramate dehydrogenase [Isoalcanivorax indicus]